MTAGSASAEATGVSEGTIRYWAAAKAEAGTGEEPYRAATLAEALAAARALHADRPRFAQVLRLCSFLVDGDPVGGRDHATVELKQGGTVEVLPPFAGG
jgi:sulfur-carrier protein